MSIRQSAQALACAVLFTVMAACGSDKDQIGSEASGAVDAEGNCTESFINRANTLLESLPTDPAACIKAIDAFAAKYAGVKCRAMIEGREGEIDVNSAASETKLARCQ